MKNKNQIIRYIGLFLLTVGIVLNIKMYVDKAYPTYLFYIVSIVGIVQIIISYTLNNLTKGWQIFWALLPLILFFLILK
jgi:hypothetical protein